MGTIAEKLEYLNGTKTAIKTAITNRGVSVSDADTFRDYATKIGDIGETVDKSKYGVTIDNLLGDVLPNGILTRPTASFEVIVDGATEINNYTYAFYGLPVSKASFPNLKIIQLSIADSVGSLAYAFYMPSRKTSVLTEIEFPSLEQILSFGLYSTFSYAACKQIEFPKLQLVGSSGCASAFEYSSIENAVFNTLEEIQNGGFTSAFYNCIQLRNISFNALKTIGVNAFNYAFRGCISLSSISFPALVSVQTSSFGSSTTNVAFRDCTALTEIHFRADMQATIEATTGYSNKWGATNATIYFDL